MSPYYGFGMTNTHGEPSFQVLCFYAGQAINQAIAIGARKLDAYKGARILQSRICDGEAYTTRVGRIARRAASTITIKPELQSELD